MYSQYKPSLNKIDHARLLFEGMRYECGAVLCTFGTEGLATILETRASELNSGKTATTKASYSSGMSEVDLLGDESIFSIFFNDESLSCSTPMEKHLYDIIPPSLTESAPCYYCGETDLVRTSTDCDQSYPLCHHCETVRKLGPVKKRKKRTIVPREEKQKNRGKKSKKAAEHNTDGFLEDITDEESEHESDQLDNEEHINESDEGASDDSMNWELGQTNKRKRTVALRKQKEKESHEICGGEQISPEESDDEVLSLPPSPNMYPPVSVEDLLDGSD